MRNNSTNICGSVRLKNSCGPRFSVRTSDKSARTRSPIRKVSRPISWSRPSSASALLPRSTITLSRVTFLTVPLIISPIRSRYNSTTLARSASRTFCTITCLAVWAAIRPKASDSISSLTRSPNCRSGLSCWASSRISSAEGLT